MKKVYMMITSWCPHCRKAKGWLEELRKDNGEYAKVDIEVIDEEKEPDKIKEHGFEYYYVPTFYVEKEKVFEGVPSKELVENVLKKAVGE